jgi:hypothetical protein
MIALSEINNNYSTKQNAIYLLSCQICYPNRFHEINYNGRLAENYSDNILPQELRHNRTVRLFSQGKRIKPQTGRKSVQIVESSIMYRIPKRLAPLAQKLYRCLGLKRDTKPREFVARVEILPARDGAGAGWGLKPTGFFTTQPRLWMFFWSQATSGTIRKRSLSSLPAN